MGRVESATRCADGQTGISARIWRVRSEFLTSNEGASWTRRTPSLDFARMHTFWQFARHMLKYRRRLIVAMACALTTAVMFAITLSFLLPVLRTVLGGKGDRITFHEYLSAINDGPRGWVVPDWLLTIVPTEPLPGFMFLIGLLILTTCVGAISRLTHAYLSMTLVVMTIADIRIKVFSVLMRLPLMQIVAEPITEKISRVMRDSNQLGRGFTALLSKTMAELLKGIAALVVALLVSWQIAGLALLLTPILALYYRRHGRKVRRSSRAVLAESAKLLGSITQSMMGTRVVKVHTAERFEIGRFRKANRDYLTAEFPLRWRKSVASPTIEVLTTIAFGIIAVFAAKQIMDDAIGPEEVLVCLAGLVMAATSLRQFTFLYNEVFESSAAAERLEEMMALPTERPRHENKPPMADFTNTVEFKDVTFQYPTANRPALQSIDLRIEAGQMVAFVGPNGCGKTTLLSLVPRLFDPTSGGVYIDGKNIAEVSLRSLRKQIGVVTQETVLFHDTIANNIAYGMSNISREQVEEVARRAYADGFIQRKPDLYDTMVGDQGSTLSGGERQRLAIARAILRDPRILILDEATSMIDAESEAAIAAALDDFCKHRTSLVIAHRLSTVVNADMIVVLDHGEIIDRGRHDELLKRCELYKQLCKHQLVSESEDAA